VTRGFTLSLQRGESSCSPWEVCRRDVI